MKYISKESMSFISNVKKIMMMRKFFFYFFACIKDKSTDTYQDYLANIKIFTLWK